MATYNSIFQPIANLASRTYADLEPEMQHVQAEIKTQFLRLFGAQYSTNSFASWTNLAVFILKRKADDAVTVEAVGMHKVRLDLGCYVFVSRVP